jgi:hypothetical protein
MAEASTNAATSPLLTWRLHRRRRAQTAYPTSPTRCIVPHLGRAERPISPPACWQSRLSRRSVRPSNRRQPWRR